MAREIKLKISLDGSQKVVAGIDEIGNGLHELDVQDARNAKRALDQIDKSTFKNISNQLKTLSDSITNAGQKLTVGLTVPITGVTVAAVKSFADIELAVANISTIKPEIDTSKVMTALNEMSTRIPQTAQQLGDGLYNIFSSINVTQEEGLKLLEQFGRGATAAQTDAQTFGTAVLGVMNAYRMNVADATHITDVFFNTVNLGVVNGQELASSLGEVTQSAKNAGVGLDELGALIVGVTKEGGSAAQNINNLSNFLQKLPTKESSDAIRKLGVDVQSADGKFRPIIDVLGDLKTKLDAMTPAARALALQKIFPDAQAKTGVQTLLSQLDAIKEALEVNRKTAGAASAAYQKIAGTVSVQLSLLKNSAIAILAELGSALLPLIQPLILWIAQRLVPTIKGAVDSFKAWSPTLQIVAVAIASFVAALGPLLTVAGVVIGVLISIGATLAPLIGFIIQFAGLIGVVGLVPAFTALFTVIGGMIIPVLKLLIPIVVVVGSVLAALSAAVVTLVVVWQTNFGGIRDFTLAAWNIIKSTVSAGMAYIYSVVQSVGGKVIAWWKENYPIIQSTVQTVSTRIQATVQTFLGAVYAFWQQHGTRIMSFVKSSWGLIGTTISGVMTLIGNIIRIALQLINGDWDGAWQSLLKAVQQTTAFIVQHSKEFVDMVGKALYALLPILYQLGVQSLEVLTSAALKIVSTVVYIIATLPIQVARLAPRFIAAGYQIGEAIWQGIKDAMAGNASATGSLFGEGMSEAEKNAAKAAADNAEQYNQTVYDTVSANNQLKSSFGGVGDGAGKAGKKIKETLTPIQQLRKDATEAANAIAFFFGRDGTEAQGLTVRIDKLNEMKTNLVELIKMRDKYNQLDVAKKALPSNASDIEKDLVVFKNAEDGLNKANEMLKDYQNAKKGIGSESTEIEKVNNLISQQGALIDQTTQAKLRENAVDQDRKNRAKELADVKKQLIDSGFNERLQISEQIKLSESQLLLGRELSDVEKQQIKNSFELTKAEEDWKSSRKSSNEIEILRNTLLTEQADTIRLLAKSEEERNNVIAAQNSKALISDLEEEIRQLNVELGHGTELSRADAIAKELQTDAYKNLTPEMRKAIEARAQEIDSLRAAKEAQKKYQEVFDQTANYIDDKLHVLRESGFKGLFKSLLQDLEDFLIRAAAKFLASKFLQLLQGKFGSGSSSGGGFSNILRQLFGGGGSGSGGLFGGNQGGGIFNFGGSSSSGISIPGMAASAPIHSGQANAGGGGGIGLGGGLILAGMAANVVGSLIGGRAGTFISNIGGGVASGASIGMMFGGPLGAGIGAAIGGAVGLLQSIFGGDPKRKADKKENLPKLQQGFVEAFKALQDLAADKNALFSDPDGTLAKARELREQIRNGFGVQMLSKKYQKIAQQQIAQKLVEADAIIAEITKAADAGRIASDADNRLQTSFASGVYMDKGFLSQYGAFKRRNGMLAGAWSGRDVLPSMLAMGEMVLNPNQISRVKAAAGFDPFKSAGIPGYAGGTYVAPSASTPSVSVPAARQPINITLVLSNQGMVASDIKDVLIDSLGDSEVQVKVVETYDKGKSRKL